MNRIEVITSVERRRRWSRAEKERWVAAMEEPGAVAAEVARKARVAPCLLYRWRQQLLASPGIGSFIPVSITAPVTDREPELARPGAITIEFSGSIRLKVEGAPDSGTLTSIIDALSNAERRR
jgi:transposase